MILLLNINNENITLMRILFSIAHYYKPQENGRYGSTRDNDFARITALSYCLSSILQLFGNKCYTLNIVKKTAEKLNYSLIKNLDIVICTDGQNNLLDKLNISPKIYKHAVSQENPKLLGFFCQKILEQNLGKYDYYCYLEDDLIIHDSWFFTKLEYFSKKYGDICLLHPNRYEVSTGTILNKLYVDGDIRLANTEKFCDIQDTRELNLQILDREIILKRPLNPHSGCYFLNAKQMEHWSKQPYFNDVDVSFIGPLESAASLGIMKTFKLYKPAEVNPDFLEIQHFGTNFINIIGKTATISTV